MKINVWKYLDEFEIEKHEIMEAVLSVFLSGKLILGTNVENFEKVFSKYCDCKYGVGVGNGTDALFLALKSLNIGHNDEVITVSNTAVPTVSAIVSTGAKPVFVDICRDTYLIDVDKIEQNITENTKAILAVHLFGQCANMDKINSIAKRYDLKVIEDCAQAHGAEHKGHKAGSMSDIAAFSFYPTKILGAYGDGGIVLTNEKKLYDKLKRLRIYGMEKEYYAHEHGYNSRLDEIQAAILLKKMNHLNEYIEKRRKIAEIYDNSLKETDLILPKVKKNNKHTYYLYVCRHLKRDLIIKELRKLNINLNISYPYPIHTMPAYSQYFIDRDFLLETDAVSKEIFSLPMYPSLKLQDVEIVCDAIIKILKII